MDRLQEEGHGRVSVLKDATWKGASAFDAYRFTIDKDGKRHEFVVPFACGNVALRSVGPIPPPPVAAAPRPAEPAAPAPVAPPPPVAAPAAVAAPAPVAPPPAPVAPQPVAAAPAPVATAAAYVAPAPPPAPVPPPPAKPHGGLLFDVGLARQPDPANYAFARVGYELPLFDKLYLMGLVGGSVRWMGNDGGSAFTADLLLDYHWLDKLSFGLGAGFWSGTTARSTCWPTSASCLREPREQQQLPAPGSAAPG